MVSGLGLIIVLIKLIAPKIGKTSSEYNEKMVKSPEVPVDTKFPANGG
jgi:hypothetical protein